MRSIRMFTLALSLVGVLVVLAAFCNQEVSKKVPPSETTKGFAVVELFTSEGCSSCPPADELVAEIQKENGNRDIYILAFHVDYWDHQGWKDKFSDHEFSERQRQYASWLDLQSVYTPQIVINGASEYVGSDQNRVLKAISAGLDKEPAKKLTLTGSIGGGNVNVQYQGAGDGKRSELVLALVQKSAQSNVGGGENAGRNLSHVQIVRQMVHVPISADGKKGITMSLPKDFDQKGWELIGFVQHKTDGHITGAARYDFQAGLAVSK